MLYQLSYSHHCSRPACAGRQRVNTIQDFSPLSNYGVSLLISRVGVKSDGRGVAGDCSVVHVDAVRGAASMRDLSLGCPAYIRSWPAAGRGGTAGLWLGRAAVFAYAHSTLAVRCGRACRRLAVPQACCINRSHVHMATVTLFVYVHFNNDGEPYCLLVFRRVALHAMFGFWYTSK
ncbi:hypothetical protein [Bifidobacterium stellenboschense]|uniref:hypothetical protein n=1 Tax=Bifidobacterium stellenboschense TaxID=762211 RepID=UPI0012EBC4B7|nr:hypothetical protein [Bifidobacterium stellenboschense]